ncbi:class II histocompatibility antigen, M alpha chain [Lacerta agilis]|uniref:class II histocompatibility antigen, M alpha chain n=1 Tax=Lacerta agilis TaxID=80427 RepID=UPI001419FF4D|nr:class II histocompatibility antigen, M alpha chain [Lacerta agilis]
MGPGGRCSWGLAALAWLWGASAAASAEVREDPAHLFSEVYLCQQDSPLPEMVQTLDNEELFWFNSSESAWHARLRDFQPGVQNRTPQGYIRRLNQLCNDVLSNFSYYFAIMPEAKGVAQVEVIPLLPLQLGQPNTLVCSVTNLFPPAAEVTWTRQGQPVTQGVSTPPAIPVQDLDFRLFSYLEVTPQEGDIYSCDVKSPRDTFSIQAFWVPQDPVPSELLENILCGAAFGVGTLFAIAGVVLVAVSCKCSSTE